MWPAGVSVSTIAVVLVVRCDVYLQSQSLPCGICHLICQERGFNYDLASMLHVSRVGSD